MGNGDRTWTEEQLRRAVRRWEKRLAEQGKTELTIRTYVRDADAFLDDLTGKAKTRGRPADSAPLAKAALRRVAAAKARPETSAPVGRASAATLLRASGRTARTARTTRATIPLPADLRRLYRDHVAMGSPRQGAIRWPRDRWVAMFPGYASFFADTLPDCVSRASVRRIARGAIEGEKEAVLALLAVLTWGMGAVGNGPWRGQRMLTCRPDAAACLRAVAQTLAAEGPVAAYTRLKGDCRLEYLGPSFGTKYLSLCQAEGAQPVALIHDDLIRGWLEDHGRPDLAASYYSVPVYEGYLAQMQAWADGLGIDPETVEYLIFQAKSKARGNQWAILEDCPEWS